MMSGVVEPSLPAMAASIGSLPPADEPPSDRLDELARWWAQVTGLPSSAAEPKRVERLWAPEVPFGGPREIGEVIHWAVAAADRVIDGGAELVLIGVPATGTIAPAVLAASLLRLDAAEAIGWPSASGIDDADWMVRVTTVREGLRRLRGPFELNDDACAADAAGPDPAQLLRRLADPWMTAACTAVLRCASRRTPMVLEGFGAAVSGLFGWHANAQAAGWFQVADGPIAAGSAGAAGARDGLHDRVLTAMQREPLARLGLSRVNGYAAQIAVAMLQMALERAAR